MKLMVIGFLKSGTTTLTSALEASGLKAAHWQDENGDFIGELMYRAVYKGLDPFALLTGFDAVTQADVCLPRRNINYWPNLDFAMLRAVRRAHPTCLLLLNYRDPEAICDSMLKWKGLQVRLTDSEIPGLPRGIGYKRQHLVTWIENHFDACRTFFGKDEHFLELDIAAPDAPERLSKAIGVPIVAWERMQPNYLEAPESWTQYIERQREEAKAKAKAERD